MNKFPLFLALIILPRTVFSEVSFSHSGYLSTRASQYTTDKNNEKNGQRHRVQFEQIANVNDSVSVVNQLRWKYNSLYSDLSTTPPSDKEETHDIYLGDNYIKYKASAWVLQTGYQEVAWGEAFGFNYADIVNPKDLKETFYSDYSESRLPLFLVNFKYFFENGSLQLIYSPEPRFSENLPVNLFTRGILPQTKITTIKEDSPDFFKKHEYGGKLSASFWGIDSSIFYFSYLNRDPNYILQSATVDSVVLSEEHARVKTTGLSLAKTIYDNFVFRTDVVYSQDKKINSLQGFNLLSTPVNSTDVLLSLDTPTYSNFSGVLIYATSRLSKDLPLSFREQNLNYSIAKLSYDFGEEKTFDLSYTHEFGKTGHGTQALYSWPVNATLELKFGAEFYWGDSASQLYKVKNVSNVFFGLKNYFQL